MISQVGCKRANCLKDSNCTLDSASVNTSIATDIGDCVCGTDCSGWSKKICFDDIYIADDIKPERKKNLILTHLLPGLLYLWIGDSTISFKDLHFAIQSNQLDKSSTLPSANKPNSDNSSKSVNVKPIGSSVTSRLLNSTLIGELDSHSSDIAKWLSNKVNLPVLVSCNVEICSNENLIDLYDQILKTLVKNGFFK